MQKGGGGVQKACKIAYVLNGRPLEVTNIAVVEMSADNVMLRSSFDILLVQKGSSEC